MTAKEFVAIPASVATAARTHDAASPRDLHRLKVALAELVLTQAQPAAQAQLALARQFVDAQASSAELLDARQDCWAYIGSLACYCTLTDSASAQAVLACLEPDDSQHTPESLLEQVGRVLRCGVPVEQVLNGLAR